MAACDLSTPEVSLWSLPLRSLEHSYHLLLVWPIHSLFAFYRIALGLVVSGVLYVNLAGYHVRAVTSDLVSGASGVFVTSLYGSAAIAGYSIGWLANNAGIHTSLRPT